MNCSNCQNPIQAGEKFCGKCGSPIQIGLFSKGEYFCIFFYALSGIPMVIATAYVSQDLASFSGSGRAQGEIMFIISIGISSLVYLVDLVLAIFNKFMRKIIVGGFLFIFFNMAVGLLGESFFRGSSVAGYLYFLVVFIAFFIPVIPLYKKWKQIKAQPSVL